MSLKKLSQKLLKNSHKSNMNNILGNAVYYSEEKISTSELNLTSYVTTDSLLANKKGKCDSVNLPPNSEKCTRFKKGDILVANIRPYLKKIWFADIDGGCSADVLVFKTKEGYLPSFIYYALLRDDFFIHSMKGSTGTKMPRGNKDHLLEFLIPDFDYAQQEKISKVLSLLDAKIISNNKINSELEKMTKLIFDYWFIQFDFPDENGKPYKSSGGKMVFNKDLSSEIPYGWEVIELGNMFTFQKGISYSSKDVGLTGTPMINLDSFYLDGRYKEEGIKYFNGNVNSDKLCKKGDLVIAVTDVTRNADIIGKGFLIPDLFNGDCLISTDVAKVELSDRLTKDFIIKLFNSDNYHNYIKNFATGTLVLHLDLDGIRWSKIALPPLELQKKYSEINKSAQLKFTNSMKENQSLSKTRDWLLPMLMNSQITFSVSS